MYALAERLHIDEDEILDWPYEKLSRWILRDEVLWMVNAVKTATKNLTDEDALQIVRHEQERSGWRGVTKRGGGNGE